MSDLIDRLSVAFGVVLACVAVGWLVMGWYAIKTNHFDLTIGGSVAVGLAIFVALARGK